MTATILKIAPDAAYTFDDFWSVYPRRVARKDAQKAWAKVDPAEHFSILGALVIARRSDAWLQDGGKFIPYPATWLNAKGWEDEIFKPEAESRMGKFVI